METDENEKGRRVLGEVQLYVDTPPAPSTSNVGRRKSNDQRNLKEQINSTTQQLNKLDSKIEDLKRRLGQKTSAVEKLETEKGKLLGEKQQLLLEKQQLRKLLDEEVEVRKQIQLQSHKLVGDIKSSYDLKISKLRSEIKIKEDVVGIKQDLIREMESLVKQLRDEIRSLNTQLQEIKNRERETKGKMSQNFRGSISMMQSQISRKSVELEGHIKDLESKHADEYARKISEFDAAKNLLQQELEEKNREIEEVKMRLAESRESRESTLKEMTSARNKYTSTIKILENALEEARGRIEELQHFKDQDANLAVQVELLEKQLYDSIKSSDELQNQIETITNEKHELEDKVSHLQSVIEKLEKTISELEQQKRMLYAKTEEYLKKSQDIENDNSAIRLLKDKLEESQSKFLEMKQELEEEKNKTSTLEERIVATEKSYGLAKVDVRVLTRQKNCLDDQLKRKSEELKMLSDQLETTQSSEGELKKKISELERLNKELQSKTDEHAFDLTELKKILEETKEAKNGLAEEVSELKKELDRLKAQLSETTSLKQQIELKDKELSQKNEALSEKSRKIESLNGNIQVLKEASSILDQQLKDFENSYLAKIEELRNSEALRVELNTENSSLKEELKKKKTELNEAVSLKTFVDNRLKELEEVVSTKEVQHAEALSSLTSQVESLRAKNAELVESCNKYAAELENASAERNHTAGRYESVNADNMKLTQEIYRYVGIVVDLKDKNIELTSAIKAATLKGESYKRKLEDLQIEHGLVLRDKSEYEIQAESTISQQAKLIEYLQSQNEMLSKKKKFHLFSKEKEDPLFPYCTPSRKGMTTPRRMGLTDPIATPKSHTLGTVGISRKQPSALTIGKCTDENLLAEFEREEREKKSEKFHSFVERTVMKTEKCWKCVEPIYFGRLASMCTTCTAIFHASCSASVGKSCGLDMEDVVDFERNLSHETLDSGDGVSGWIRIARENEWVKRHIRVKLGMILLCEDASGSSPVVESFPLTPKTRVELRIDQASVKAPIAPGMLPFLLKVITPESGKDSEERILLISTESNGQKRFWTRTIFDNSIHKDSMSDIIECQRQTSGYRVRESVIFRSNKDMVDVNCAYFLGGDIFLFGCDDGLYSKKLSNPMNARVKIDGIGALYQIEFISSLNLVLFIEGTQRNLTASQMGLLRSCAEAAECSRPTLTSSPAADVSHCHMFQCYDAGRGDVFLAVSTAKHLHLLCWNGKKATFILLKKIPTAESVTCMLMTPDSVIFGSDKLYEVDSKTFQVEEFLDASDDTLYYLKYSCDVLSTFPVAIIDVGMSNYTPVKGSYMREYLLCFSDMGVFVDEYGRRTREEDIVWSKLPVAVAYRHPNLFVLHFSSVEVLRLNSESFTRRRVNLTENSIGKEITIVPDSNFLLLSSPRILGSGSKTASILLSSIDKHKTDVIEVDLDHAGC